jgi:DNA-binding XRE family transcriptional regulator
MKSLGERLKEERERLKLSQEAFGDVGGVKRLAQINYERNDRAPDATYLQQVAAIGADVLYILTGNRTENTAHTAVELSYLRICKMLPDNKSRMIGNSVLLGLLNAYSIQMDSIDVSANDSDVRHVASPKAEYKSNSDIDWNKK